MASNRSRLPWTPPEYQRDRRDATVSAAESRRGQQNNDEIRRENDSQAEKTNTRNANTMQPELPFGLLLKKAIRGDTHAVTIEEALEHLETIAKARIDASVDPELDPNARVDMWLNQSNFTILESKEYLNDDRLDNSDEDCFEPLDDVAAVTLEALSMTTPEERREEERCERSGRPKESMDEN